MLLGKEVVVFGMLPEVPRGLGLALIMITFQVNIPWDGRARMGEELYILQTTHKTNGIHL